MKFPTLLLLVLAIAVFAARPPAISITGCQTALAGGIESDPGLTTFNQSTGATNTAASKRSPGCNSAAALLAEDTSTGTHQINGAPVVTYPVGTQQVTLYAKEISGNRDLVISIADNAFASNASAQFNLVTGAISVAPSTFGAWSSPSAKIYAVNDGWLKITLTFTTTAYTAVQVNYFATMALNAGGAASYTGTTGSIALWGFDFRTVSAAPVTGFFISTLGNDSWSGTLPAPNGGMTDGPFATFARAQTAMRGSATKTVYVRAGTYTPPITAGAGCGFGAAAAVNLTSADNGETWSYYSSDGYGTAVLNGGAPNVNQNVASTQVANGTLACAFGGNGATNITIDGLQFDHWYYSAIALAGNTYVNWTIRNNTIHDTQSAAYPAAAVDVACTNGSTISHNYLYNIAYEALRFGVCSGGAAVLNSSMTGNFIDNSCTWGAIDSFAGGNGGDCGGIYMGINAANSNVNITNNYIRDVNVSSHGAGLFSFCCTEGVYLDAYTYNINISGNVVTGINSQCFFDRGGGNTINGNLCDIGNSTNNNQQWIVADYIMDGTAISGGRTFQHNVVVANSGGAGSGFANFTQAAGATVFMTIQNNGYFNYGGAGAVTHTGSQGNGDTSATYVDPQINCWAVSIAGGSPVLGAPVSFPGITGGWGPPGFSVPHTGTAPSWPHAC